MPVYPIAIPTPSAAAYGSGATPVQLGVPANAAGSGAAPIQLGGSSASAACGPAPTPIDPGDGVASPSVAAPIPINPGGGGSANAAAPIPINPATPIPTPDSALSAVQADQVVALISEYLTSGEITEIVLTAPNGNKRRLALNGSETPKWTRLETAPAPEQEQETPSES